MYFRDGRAEIESICCFRSIVVSDVRNANGFAVRPIRARLSGSRLAGESHQIEGPARPWLLGDWMAAPSVLV
jgi:hypothetical protein